VAKVTSKYQVSIPRRLADRLSITPGDDIEWTIAGSELRISRASTDALLSAKERLAMFDAATRRQAARNRRAKTSGTKAGRGWTREELYERGRSR
jgi:bifunctional DNA-binding transcriptional regulator/antitoxin component of YhaV-PrlF toxin-antitoxin module